MTPTKAPTDINAFMGKLPYVYRTSKITKSSGAVLPPSPVTNSRRFS